MKIAITGASGFIGRNLVKSLENYHTLCLFDIDNREEFHNFLSTTNDIDFVVHLGAITDTTIKDWQIFKTWNLDYSKKIWDICTTKMIPLIYASSAATYGNGIQSPKKLLFSDNALPSNLKPLNPYGKSKNDFDDYALQSHHNYCLMPPFWAGLKFFNVYGYGEQDKGRMASVVYHAYNQIQENGKMKLFKWGEQKRDFVYVEDVCDVIDWMIHRYNPSLDFSISKPIQSGLYNIGTNMARTFLDLANSVFKSLQKEKTIEYIDMPKDLYGIYQNFTQADITKLRQEGYSKKFTSLEEGVDKYVKKLNS